MKMKALLLLSSLLMIAFSSSAQYTEKSLIDNSPVVYSEIIDQYIQLDNKYAEAKLIEYGKSDNGKPIHLFVISTNKIFNVDSLKKQGFAVLFINNGIHPGEPDGIKASLRLSSELLKKQIPSPEKTVICIVPIYNVDGALETSQFFRSGQNGPNEVGFRGNARHLDLNRDFIKCDSENAKTFTKMYRDWDPDVFVDTHVSDGADYQYTITLIDSQKDKLHPEISKVMQGKVLPFLYEQMEKSGFPITPYVNVWGEDPEKGMSGFLESPRYASGYSALYNAFPFVTETHMLKPFPQRIEATYQFLKANVLLCESSGNEIRTARKKANEQIAKTQIDFPLHWKLDSTKVDSLNFRGYKALKKKSEVTSLDILYFDQQQPFQKNIAFYNTFKSSISVKKPLAYLIPQAWHEVIDRLKLNRVEMFQLNHDTLFNAACYYIKNYNTGKSAYEGHYLHNNVNVVSDTALIRCCAGDYIIYCNQNCNRYIIETLEPHAQDAFFAWNFFDEILQQKEYFSDYLWDDVAIEFLKEHPAIKEEFEEKKRKDSTFAASTWAMYSWIFERSKWYEPSHLRYPVLRLDHKIPENMLQNKTNKISNN